MAVTRQQYDVTNYDHKSYMTNMKERRRRDELARICLGCSLGISQPALIARPPSKSTVAESPQSRLANVYRANIARKAALSGY